MIMRGFIAIGAAPLIGLLLAGPAPAQQASPDNPPSAAEQHATPNPTATPAPAPNATAAPEEPGTAAGTATPPNLVVATVTAKNGRRASKLIGSGVYNDQNQQIGSIDDLIVTPDAKITIAVISVGGFLGIGSKLVAVPYDQIHLETGKDAGLRLVLPGATKETLNTMPSFTFGNT
jgi:sporulation protein YlmC with PRC-barrel domain